MQVICRDRAEKGGKDKLGYGGVALSTWGLDEQASTAGARFPVVAFDCTRIDDGPYDDTTLVRPNEVLYAFTRGATPGSKSKLAPRVIGGWVGRLYLAPDTVFLRTGEGVFQTDFRSLKDFAVASPVPFAKISRSVWVNLPRVEFTELRRQPVKKLGFRVAGSDLSWGFEFVVVSRRYVPCARCVFGIGAGVRPCALSRCDDDTKPSA